MILDFLLCVLVCAIIYKVAPDGMRDFLAISCIALASFLGLLLLGSLGAIALTFVVSLASAASPFILILALTKRISYGTAKRPPKKIKRESTSEIIVDVG